MESAFGQILDRTAKRMRAGIAAIPDGSYRFEDVLDDDGLKERNVKFALEVRKAGERIVVRLHWLRRRRCRATST